MSLLYTHLRTFLNNVGEYIFYEFNWKMQFYKQYECNFE